MVKKILEAVATASNNIYITEQNQLEAWRAANWLENMALLLLSLLQYRIYLFYGILF